MAEQERTLCNAQLFPAPHHGNRFDLSCLAHLIFGKHQNLFDQVEPEAIERSSGLESSACLASKCPPRRSLPSSCQAQSLQPLLLPIPSAPQVAIGHGLPAGQHLTTIQRRTRFNRYLESSRNCSPGLQCRSTGLRPFLNRLTVLPGQFPGKKRDLAVLLGWQG